MNLFPKIASVCSVIDHFALFAKVRPAISKITPITAKSIRPCDQIYILNLLS